jgi:regulator of replication initiation timing
LIGSILGGGPNRREIGDYADEVILARKEAKSRRRVTGLRSKTTKARTPVDRLRANNADLKKKLAEMLEQQTATSEVLQVISSSPGELEPVFQVMLANAMRICEAKFGNVFRLENGAMQPVASLGTPEPLTKFFQQGPHRPHIDAPIMRVARTLGLDDGSMLHRRRTKRF